MWRCRGTGRGWIAQGPGDCSAFALAVDHHAMWIDFVLRDDSLGEAAQVLDLGSFPLVLSGRRRDDQHNAVAVADCLPLADDVVGLRVGRDLQPKKRGLRLAGLVRSGDIDAALVGEFGELQIAGFAGGCFSVASVGEAALCERMARSPGMLVGRRAAVSVNSFDWPPRVSFTTNLLPGARLLTAAIASSMEATFDSLMFVMRSPI